MYVQFTYCVQGVYSFNATPSLSLGSILSQCTIDATSGKFVGKFGQQSLCKWPLYNCDVETNQLNYIVD